MSEVYYLDFVLSAKIHQAQKETQGHRVTQTTRNPQMELLPNVGAKIRRIFEVRMDKKTTIPNKPEQSLIAKKASEISLRRFMIKKHDIYTLGFW